jgi:hypothetical protein
MALFTDFNVRFFTLRIGANPLGLTPVVGGVSARSAGTIPALHLGIPDGTRGFPLISSLDYRAKATLGEDYCNSSGLGRL